MYIEKLPNGKFKCVQRYKDYLTGKTKRVSVTIEKNTLSKRKEAMDLLKNKIEQLNNFAPEREYTLSDIAKLYLEYQANHVKSSSYHTLISRVNTLVRALNGDVLINNLTATYVINALSKSIKQANTINNKIKLLKAVLHWAYKQDLVDSINWLDKLTLFNSSERKEIEEKYLEAEELRELLSRVKNKQYKDIFTFLALSGLRIGETLALNTSDIDIEKRTIIVNKTITIHDNQITTPKSSTSNRIIYMQDELLEFVKRKIADNKTMQIAIGLRSPLLFFNSKGKIYNYCSLYNSFKSYCREYLGRPLGLHSLRHTHASLMFEQGMSLEAISERLGHSESNITKQVYLHITAKLKEKYNEEIKNVHIL